MGGRDISRPEPGFFALKLVKGGVLVPARIYRSCPMDPFYGHPMDRTALCADIDGADCNVDRVWLYGRRITAGEWAFMTADSAHAKAYRPMDPKAKPDAAIDLNSIPTLF